MSRRSRGPFLLKWLRNTLIVAALICFWLGATTLVDQHLQSATALPVPPAFDDPSAQPAFDEETTDALPQTNCVSCHWDLIGKGERVVAAEESGLPAPGARALAAEKREARRLDAGITVGPPPTPTRPPLPVPRARTAPAPSPTASPPPASGLPVRLTIASLGIDSEVVAVAATRQKGETVWEVPRDVVGWFKASAMPGAIGNSVMSGHVAQREGLGVFRDLYQVRLGDAITVETTAGRVSYFVREIRIVLPSDTQYLQPTQDKRLTLITCTGHYDAATHTFSHRLIVIAGPR